MRRRTVILAGAVAAAVAGAVVGGVATSQAQTITPAIVAPPSVPLGGSPYEYPVTGGKDPVAVMHSTGVKAFTLAFILAKNGCNPVWDGGTALTSSGPANRITAIRNAGGDVVISVGGASGDKLGNA